MKTRFQRTGRACTAISATASNSSSVADTSCGRLSPVSGLYRYAFKLEDRIAAPKTFPHNFAEEDTDATEHLYIAQLNFSTIPLYLQHRFPIPLNLFLAYRDRFAGSGARASGSPSQVLKTRYISVGLQFIF